MAKGFYKAGGFEVEIISAKANVIDASLVGGGIDYSANTPGTIRSIAAGMPAKLLFVGASGRPFFIVSKTQIKSIRDLKGKIIAVNQIGTSDDFFVKKVASHGGLDP